MLIIPLTAVPSQRFSILLGGQNCQIAVYQKTTGLFIDLAVNNVPILQTHFCRDRVRMAAQAYFGFVGSLRFADTQGTLDPVWTGLGDRFKLTYQ